MKRYTLTCDEGEVRFYAMSMDEALPASKRMAATLGWRWRAVVGDGPALHEDINRLRCALDVLLVRRELLPITSDVGNALEAALERVMDAWRLTKSKDVDI